MRWGSHFRQALADENLCIEDVRLILRKGVIFSEPEQDIRSGEWKYTMEGTEPDGQWIKVVFSFKSSEIAFLITILSAWTRR